MERTQIYDEIEATLGFVPGWLLSLSDQALEHEWQLFKNLKLADTNIPNKYKELIAAAVSAALGSYYASILFTQLAYAYGATDAEVEEASEVAMDTAGWSTYLNSIQPDAELFEDEVVRLRDYLIEAQKAA